MRKTTLALALMVSMSSVQAATYDLMGTFQMRDPTGMLLAYNTVFDGSSMQLDMATGVGTADLHNEFPFGQMAPFSYYLFHDVNIQITGPSTAFVNLLLDWGSSGVISITNIYITMDMSFTENGDGSINFITLDGPSSDGIPGNPMDNGLPGFNAALNLTATSVVPVPAAVWLFGSGLIGLVGFARRKKA